jgi:predicted  nucleic acid-binding Zn-ribbon protein
MTQQRRTALKELQKLDVRIQEESQGIRAFDPLFEEIEEPALILESELGTVRKRLKEMQLEEARLELSLEERKERLKRLDERVLAVRNLREEAAVSAELEMVKRALQNDEQEAFSLLDLVRKAEERLAELETAYAEASAEVEPKKQALLDERDAKKKELDSLQKEREGFTTNMDPGELRIYDAIRGGGGRAAVSELTEDGACGNCFGIVPLQVQNEILHGDSLIRCEACGVVLAAPEPVEEVEETAPEAEGGEAEESAGSEEAAEADEAGAEEAGAEEDEVEE